MSPTRAFRFALFAKNASSFMKGVSFMRQKIIEIANEQGLTGLKRVGFYIVAPIVSVASFAVGYVIGITKALKKSI